MPQTPVGTTDPSILDRLATAIADLHRQVATRPDTALDALAECVLAAISGAEHVGIGRVTGTGFEHAAETSEIAQRFAARQAERADGPTLDVAAGAGVSGSDDLHAEERWPGLRSPAALDGEVRSVLAVRVPSGEDGEPPLIVTVLSSRPHAFAEPAAVTVLSMATCGMLAATNARRAARIENLERALETNRDIGTAIGVLMGLHRTTREHAFNLLRQVSQTTHRKVSDIARLVAETGSLDLP